MRHRNTLDHRPRRVWWAPWRKVCRCGEPSHPCYAARMLLIHGRQEDARARQKQGNTCSWNGPTATVLLPIRNRGAWS